MFLKHLNLCHKNADLYSNYIEYNKNILDNLELIIKLN